MTPSVDYINRAFNSFVDLMNTGLPGERSWSDSRILSEAKWYTWRRDEKLKSKLDEVSFNFEEIEAFAKDLYRMKDPDEDHSSYASLSDTDILTGVPSSSKITGEPN